MSKELQIVNFIGLSQDSRYKLMVHCWASGFLWEQVQTVLSDAGIRTTEKQFRALCTLLDEQLALDLQGEPSDAR